ncbi:unnamed protein product [Sphenostylis stenocarpa]|uniref:Uncharacterized protein n=1 Tax=Sphenostylis stenocarpa TaxID=92480 RepID=A0AA86VQD0_9FABA|nr:unnamed protein product [Sphenostylis stenocarpa]
MVRPKVYAANRKAFGATRHAASLGAPSQPSRSPDEARPPFGPTETAVSFSPSNETAVSLHRTSRLVLEEKRDRRLVHPDGGLDPEIFPIYRGATLGFLTTPLASGTSSPSTPALPSSL